MRTLLTVLDRNAERYLLLVFYALIVVVIGAEVIRRYVLAYSSIWGEEVARYAFIYVSWIGASAAVKNRSHIRIDFLYMFLPQSFHIWLYLFSNLAMLVLACIAFYWFLIPIEGSIRFGAVTEGLRINRAFYQAAVPIGFGLMVVRLVQSMMRDISDYRAGRPLFTSKKLFEDS